MATSTTPVEHLGLGSFSTSSSTAFANISDDSAALPNLIFSKFAAFTPKELLFVPLKAIYHVEVLFFITIPRGLIRILGLDGAVATVIESLPNLSRGRQITHWDMGNMAVAAASSGSDGAGTATRAENMTGSGFFTVFQSLRKFSGFLGYITSKWSLTCFAVVSICAYAINHKNGAWRLTFRGL